MTPKQYNRLVALIDRAGHPNTPEQEARTCGHIACRAIVEAGGLIALLTDYQPVPEPAPDPYPQHNNNERTPMTEPREIQAKWPGICRSCGEPYGEGDYVMWLRGEGCWHLECEWI